MSALPRICGWGAVTAVGLSAPATLAAWRGGIARIGDIATTALGDLRGEPVPAQVGRASLEWLAGGPEIGQWPGHEAWSIDPPLPYETWIPDGPQRLTELLLPALDEALRQAGLSPGLPPGWRLVLVLDEAVHDPDGADAALLTETLQRSMGCSRDELDLRQEGRAGVLAAVHRIGGEMASGRCAGAIVAAVSSLIRPAQLQRLVAGGLVRSPLQKDGRVPGEAAGVLVLRPEGAGVVVLGSGMAAEATVGSDLPNIGLGLSRAIRAARAGDPSLAARPTIICDLDGTRLRAHEWLLAAPRAIGDLAWNDDGVGTDDAWHPAEPCGDVAAAAGALSLIRAAADQRDGLATTPRTLVWGASDGPLRAATILAPL